MNEQINQVIEAMGSLIMLGMTGRMMAPVMFQTAGYYWVICDYERKEFWGMVNPCPTIEDALIEAHRYIKEKNFPAGAVYAIEVHSQLPKILGTGNPIRREFIEVE